MSSERKGDEQEERKTVSCYVWMRINLWVNIWLLSSQL